ncbi:uncharacterized protein At3g49140-like [Carica papaya]|uniref:uncharacterized protein At3g49140-like n=1 Tax=Carica papaya TaxID=3649 RepID=UPI000B8CED5F|nr:uncharacterized protein At3g49140-like [Carica papaya]
MIESAMAVRFPAGASFRSSADLFHYRRLWNSDEVSCGQVASSRRLLSGCLNTAWNRFQRFNGDSLSRRRNIKRNRTQATAEHLGSASDPIKQNERPHYHPFEDIADSMSEDDGDARLTAAETTRTIIEVSSKATLMITGLINDEVHENIIWPDLPYLTDQHGNVYLQVKNDEDILQSVTSDNNFVQVIIGFDTLEMMKEMELAGPSEIDFGIEEIEDENSDVEDDDESDEDDGDENYEEDWVAVLEDEDDQDDSDGLLGGWGNFETMRSSHPMYFAKKLAEVASDDPVDWMEQPPAGLAIQGLLRPAVIEEHSDIQRRISSHRLRTSEIKEAEDSAEKSQEDLDIINDDRLESGSSEDSTMSAEETGREVPINGTTFYKLEMIKIQLITEHGHQAVVEMEDFRRAQPDGVARSSAKIISRLKAGGEKTIEALKSLCCRCKGIQVEEATVIGIDSLGFDIRVCSGRQIQTLRFAFSTRAPSESAAERQLNDLLFPRAHHKTQRKKHTH